MLAAIHQTINSPVFQDIESRNLFLPTCCDIVKKYLVHKQQLQQCSDILADMLTFFHLRQELSDEGHSVIFKDVVTLSEKLLTPLINIILNIDGASSLKVNRTPMRLAPLHLAHCWFKRVKIRPAFRPESGGQLSRECNKLSFPQRQCNLDTGPCWSQSVLKLQVASPAT